MLALTTVAKSFFVVVLLRFPAKFAGGGGGGCVDVMCRQGLQYMDERRT